MKPANAGTLDPTFNRTGVLYFPLPAVYGMSDAILALPDNKSIVVMEPAAFNVPIIVARLNEDGALDRTFGPAQHGFVEVFLEDMSVAVFGLSLLANGGWLIVGHYSVNDVVSESGLLVVRQLQDGQLDTSLNGSGILFIPYDEFGSSQYTGMTVEAHRFKGEKRLSAAPQITRDGGAFAIGQPDGKFVLVSNVIDAQGQQRGIVLRRNADGSRDESFNGGFAIVELQGVKHKRSSGYGVAIQGDGQVLVCGLYVSDDDTVGAYVTCFTSTGQVDKGFNNGLPVTIPGTGLIDLRTISVRESDGRIVAVGSAFRNNIQNGLIVVLNKSGSYNLPFNNGKALFSELVPQGQSWSRCAQQANGSIVVAGSTGNGFVTEDMAAVTARYLSDGSLDQAFNSGKGFTVFNDEQGFESTRDMVVMADGRIVVCGSMWVDAEPFPYINGGWMLRYLA
jgi:uncharacterized delta-60 repeat protein